MFANDGSNSVLMHTATPQ